MAVGWAYAFKQDRKPNRVAAMISDGECDEGSTWEAALVAGNLHLDNLVVVVDYNKIQSFGTVKEIMNLEPFAQKWRAFGWNVVEIDGHNFGQILSGFAKAKKASGKPTIIIAHTIKGKGVDFMENKMEWHYFNLTAEQLKQALKRL